MNEFQNQVHHPAGVHEAGDLIRDLAGRGRPMIPCGRLTQTPRSLHLYESEPDLVSGAHIEAEPELIPENLSLTVPAGTELERIQDLAAQANAFLPISTQRHAGRSIGGLIAQGAFGLEAYAFGELKDYLLGLTFVTPEGRVVKSGGMTVKNVAGYDLAPLMWRSHGSLGLIASVVLKLRPRLEKRTGRLYRLPSLAACRDLAEQIRRRGLSVLTMIAVGRKGIDQPKSWRLAVGLGGFRETVDAHHRKLPSADDDHQDLDQEAWSDYWRDLFHDSDHQPRSPIAGRSDRRNGYAGAERLDQALDRLDQYRIVVDFGRPGFELIPDDHADGQRFISALGAQRPAGWAIDAGRPRAGRIFRDVKRAVDPRGLFAPGLFVFPEDENE
jgi:FAD/FMN-containing dehydrogenase